MPRPGLASCAVVGVVAVGAAVEANPGAARRSRVATLLAVGDIASCTSKGDEATAKLVDGIVRERPDARILALGDNAYPDGSLADFQRCYEPSWGRHKARTRPVLGNHDYQTKGAAGHFDYFGAAAGARGRGYYSFDLGSWHVVVLNSNCEEVGCGADSEQVRWLVDDLARHPRRCTLAAWHHPRFSSGRNGDHDATRPFWDALVAAGADVVLAGHDHSYERMAAQTGDGQPDHARGLVQFVVGTGGASHHRFRTVKPNSELRRPDTHGVLALTLRPGGYDWRFVPTEGRAVIDAGSATCNERR